MNQYSKPINSPDGQYQITLAEREAGNSHWVLTPTLRDTRSGETLLELSSRWSLDETHWRSESSVTLILRKYPGNHTPPDVTLTVDCAARTAQVGEAPPHPLADSESHLDGALAFTR
jgi:hypothetical protein